MNKLNIFFLILLISLSLSSASLCQEQTDIDNIPCVGLTQVLSCSGNVTVLNLNSSASYNLSTTAIGDGTYNFTFNFNMSSYSLIDCSNSTATIVVGDFEGDNLWKFAVILALVGAAFIYSLIGKIIFESNKYLIKTSLYISSMLVFAIAIQLSILTSPNTNILGVMNTSVTMTLSLIIFLIMYLLIYYIVSLFKAFKDVKKEKKNE